MTCSTLFIIASGSITGLLIAVVLHLLIRCWRLEGEVRRLKEMGNITLNPVKGWGK